MVKQTSIFYQELYKDEPSTLPDSTIENWSSIIPKGPELNIMQPMTKQELINTIKTLHKNKCPGPDGIPYEFIVKSSSQVLKPLLCHPNHSMINQSPIAFSQNGYTVLLHKKGSSSELQN